MTDAITLRGVSHRFGDQLVVDHVDLSVAPGDCFGLLGPNGVAMAGICMAGAAIGRLSG